MLSLRDRLFSSELVQDSFEAGRQLRCRSLSPVMQEYDFGLGADHVIVDRNHIDAMAPQRFQYRCDFLRKHGHISSHRSLIVCSNECRPGV